ncbi:MAG: tRNA pseudouridine(13) synthase TruD [Candidatus Pacearchaeota archaeon]
MQIDKGTAVFKHRPEDFIVEEIWDEEVCTISDNPTELENSTVDFGKLDTNDRRDFLTCTVEKINLDHFTLMSILAKELHNFPHELGWAGTKDKVAWTAQKISIFNAKIERIREFTFPGIKLKNFKWAKHKIKVGDLTANRFRIVLRDADIDAIKVLNKVRHSEYIPNLFGVQRFGSLRQENVRVGKLILKGNFREAIFEYLTAYGEDEDTEVIKAKRKLKTEKNMLLALDYFPKQLRVECSILEYLKENPGDWINALMIIGEKTLLIMCQAVQSKLFNDVLERAIDEKGLTHNSTVSLLGYNSIFSPGRIGGIEREILESYNLELKDFRVQEIPFLSLNCSVRNAFFKVENIDVETQNDEIFEGSKKIVLTFTLESGSYATTFLENFFDFR